jgi:hypothetical protein
MKHLNGVLRVTVCCLSLAGFVSFCIYAMTQKLSIAHSVISLAGTIGCLAAYAVAAGYQDSNKEVKVVG